MFTLAPKHRSSIHFVFLPCSEFWMPVLQARVRRQPVGRDDGHQVNSQKRTREEDLQLDNRDYERAQELAQSAKASKAAKYAAAPLHPPREDEVAEPHRKISTTIEKNRGLTPHRKQSTKNPRVKVQAPVLAAGSLILQSHGKSHFVTHMMLFVGTA